MDNNGKNILDRSAEEEKFKADVLKCLEKFISKVAKNEKEIYSLVEAGFEYVTEFEGAKIFRKRIL
jgi:hypothetical protein